jgi:SAM-dependent methyltransferase
MWHAFARQLSHPQGLAGFAVGKLMKLANRQPTRLAVEALDIQPGNDVLDLGCGAGQATALMLPLAAPGRVDGIDRSATMIDEANRTNSLAVRQGRSRFKCADFESLPFPDGRFDRVLASNVMYFWQDTGLVLNEIRRVLRPGGNLSIYLTSAQTMRHWKIAGAGTHRLFDADDVRLALTEAGFAPDMVCVNSVALSGGVSGVVAVATLDKIAVS